MQNFLIYNFSNNHNDFDLVGDSMSVDLVLSEIVLLRYKLCSVSSFKIQKILLCFSS